MTDIVTSSDPFRTPTQSGILEESAARVRREFPKDPDVRAEIFNAIGRVYLRRGDSDKALPLLTEALDAGRAIGHPDLRLAQSLSDLGILWRDRGDHTRAIPLARETQAAASKHLDEVLTAVADGATLDIPPQMVDERADEMFHELERSLGAQGIPIDKYLEVMNQTEEAFKESFKERAERSVRRSLVVQEVAKAESVEITDDEIRAELELAFAGQKNGARVIEQAMARDETRERVASMLRERKATAMLVDLALGGDGKPKETEAQQPADNEPAAVVGETES